MDHFLVNNIRMGIVLRIYVMYSYGFDAEGIYVMYSYGFDAEGIYEGQ